MHLLDHWVTYAAGYACTEQTVQRQKPLPAMNRRTSPFLLLHASCLCMTSAQSQHHSCTQPLLQAPVCANQRLTVGLQRDYSLEEIQANPGGLEGAVSENNGRLEESLGIQGCMGPVGPSRRARISMERCVCRARGTLLPAVPSLAQSQGWSQQSAGGVVSLEPRPCSILLCPVLPSLRVGASRALEVSYLLSQDLAPSCCAQSCPVSGLEPAERWRCLLSRDQAPSCCAQSCPVTGLEPAERWRCL